MVASESSEVAMDCVYSIPGKNVVLPAFSLATSGGQYHLHKRDCKGRGPLPGSDKYTQISKPGDLSHIPEDSALKRFFSLLLRAACGGVEQEKKEIGAQPQTPG